MFVISDWSLNSRKGLYGYFQQPSLLSTCEYGLNLSRCHAFCLRFSTVIITLWKKKASWRGKGLFPGNSPSLREVRVRIKEETKAEAMEELIFFLWFAQPSYSTKDHQHWRELNLFISIINQESVQRPIWLGPFSVEVPFSQMTRAYVKLTNEINQDT